MSRRLRADDVRRRRVHIALCLLIAGAALGCRERASGDERAAAAGSGESRSAADGGSQVLIASPRHDFGRVAQGDTLRHGFVAFNASNAVLRLDETPEVLGCSATLSLPLEPKQSGKVEVACRATVPGPLRVSLPLRAGGRALGELSLSAEVEPLLAFEPRIVSVMVPFGEKRTTTVRLRGTRAKAAHLSPADAPSPGFEFRVLPGDADQGEVIEILVAGKAVGTQAGTLHFATGLDEPREVSLPFAVKVVGTLAVSPTNPVLDLSAPGPKRAVLSVTSAQPGFSVSRVTILEGPFTASLRRVNGGFEVEVGVVEAKLSAAMRGVNGGLRITSNDRTEPTRDVPLFAVGKP